MTTRIQRPVNDTDTTALETPAVELTATLLIGDFESECSNCHMPTLIHGVDRHTNIPGRKPTPGCGARFVNTASNSPRITPHHLRAERPDLPVRGQDNDS
ncbi:hypothetical protein ACFTXJ_37425 [Streptomyces zhihengii]|uniref:hypothetical protein n=1 Tax=Streptomyces zhihengii TaxID=1818004 RepID=UPI00363421A8